MLQTKIADRDTRARDRDSSFFFSMGFRRFRKRALETETDRRIRTNTLKKNKTFARSRIVRRAGPPAACAQAIAKRFQAACAEVGPGEVGDVKHIDAVRCAFNAYDCDRGASARAPARRSPECDEDASDAAAGTSGDQAFVATTPGAVGHAALLNLRHSFLWIKVDLERTRARTPRRRRATRCTPAGRRGGPVQEGRGAVRRRARGAGARARAYRRRRGVGARFHERCAARRARGRGRLGGAGEGEETVLVMEPDIKAHFVISRARPRRRAWWTRCRARSWARTRRSCV